MKPLFYFYATPVRGMCPIFFLAIEYDLTPPFMPVVGAVLLICQTQTFLDVDKVHTSASPHSGHIGESFRLTLILFKCRCRQSWPVARRKLAATTLLGCRNQVQRSGISHRSKVISKSKVLERFINLTDDVKIFVEQRTRLLILWTTVRD